MPAKIFSQLYSLTEPDFCAYSRLGPDGRAIVTRADNIPMIFWPDGRWCIEANLYMARLFEEGLSRDGRGGSLHTYATQISPLLRYCFGMQQKHSHKRTRNNSSSEKINFQDLTDSDFSDFISGLLSDEEYEGLRKVRSKNYVISIGRRCLDFLHFVGNYHQITNFVGPTGQITAQQKSLRISSLNRNAVAHRTYWSHRAFPAPGPHKKRLPISEADIKALNEVVHNASSSVYLKKRRYLMLTLLEVTGARRSEIAELTVSSVQNAALMNLPSLELVTKKRGSQKKETRLVPILRSVLVQILEFIEKNRALVIRRMTKSFGDHDFVLVSETTGKPLSANTITAEIHFLRKAAGLRGRIHPHMFRHTFITRLFKALVEQHSLRNPNDLRNYLLDGEKLKREAAEWTGHTNIHSLENYIHLAFEGTQDYVGAIGKVAINNSINIALRSIASARKELDVTHSRASLKRTLDSLSELLEIISKELELPSC